MKALLSRCTLAVGALTLGLTGFGISAAAPVAAVPSLSHAPRVPAPGPRGAFGGLQNTWAASNWSGYAETGSFTGASGTWTVPSVSATSSATYSSTWIGVDGFNNSNLIQTGTDQDYYSGATHYDAWWEILPSAETQISTRSYPVSPGDRMSASIYETSTLTTVSSGFRRVTVHVWSIVISDTTKGWKFSTSQGYSGSGTSAEWIEEAPSTCGRFSCQVLPLAHYAFSPPANTGDFDNAGILSKIVSSGTPAYSSAGLNYQNDSGAMIQNGVQVSTPGNPDTASTAFNSAYGSSLPSTPTG